MLYPVGHKVAYKRVFTQEDYDRFAKLSWDDNPIHVDPAFAKNSYFGGTLAHGMCLYATLCKGLSELVPGPGVIQLEQELKFPNGVYVGEEILFSLTVEQHCSDGSLGLGTKISKHKDGQEVVVSRGSTRVTMVNERNIEPLGGRLDCQEQTLFGLRVGQRAQIERTFHRQDLKEYCDLIGDKNPLYRSDSYAQQKGLLSTPVPGPLLGGMFSFLLGTELPGRGTGWMKQKLQFPSPAYLETKLTAQVEITRIRAQKEIVNLATHCQTEDGTRVCSGEALVWVHNLEKK